MGDREVDQQLVERAQRGDKKAFELLVAKYQRKVNRLLSRFIRDSAEIDDVAQEAFIKEMLPKLRKAMMGRMSEIVPEKMKQKKQYADLEIQCVALEDAEEDKWLYNFLAFMEEMK